MNNRPSHILPLGDFKPTDQWQTHINSLFYRMYGPGIHNHFQTYVSLDYRLAHSLAEDYFNSFTSIGKTRFIQEWGVGNGNLAACFLTWLKELDSENKVYPFTHYILCDYSQAILNGVRANPLLKAHAGYFSTVQIDAENLNCFKPNSVYKIISNEIWDDLATKVLLQHNSLLLEEYLQPCLDRRIVGIDAREFLSLFNEKNFDRLRECPPFLPSITWEHNYQRVDISDWPHAEAIRSHIQRVADDIPTPINVGAFATLSHAHQLLIDDSQGYTGFDYGMFSIHEINQEGRPYFNLYGGQYTFMVNFELLGAVGNAVGFKSVTKEYQHDYVGRHLQEKVLSVLEIVQTHPRVAEMEPWDRDTLMLGTLHALNGVYKSPYKRKLNYPIMGGTPKKLRKQIAQMVETLNPAGVPDTVAYVTESEVFSVIKQLKRLGYAEKMLKRAFQDPRQAISFIYMNFK